MRLYYTLGRSRPDDRVLTGLSHIENDFPSIRGTLFGSYGIDCSFDNDDNEAYIFYTYLCGVIDYANNKSSKGKEVYLFKDNKYCRIAYDSKQLIGSIQNITHGFPILKGTIFENGIDACFASHKKNQAYLFKGENYVLMNYTPDDTTYNTLVDVVKPIVDGWSSFRDILPFDNSSEDEHEEKGMEKSMEKKKKKPYDKNKFSLTKSMMKKKKMP
ncbi:hypothetical protein ACSQ67_017035 [Phaseolus vulgaris]